MKNLFTLSLIFSIFLFSISCEEDKIEEFNPKNHLLEFSNVKLQSQTFELDSIYMIVQGELGTRIWFTREQFEIEENQKITVELKEFYDFNELLFNNINTVTDKGELLESSGVIYLDFLANGKSLELKNDERIHVRFPQNRMANNDIYFAKTDSINQFVWTREDISYTTILKYNQAFGIDMLKTVRMDSLPYYRRLDSLESELRESSWLTDRMVLNKFKWINIDKVITPDYFVNFNLEIENSELGTFSCYFLYDNQDSFISQYRIENDMSFKNIPIKNKTRLLVIAKEKNNFYAQKIELDSTQSVLKMMLKKMDTLQLKKLMQK